jgi:hypothetical protein
LSNCVVLVRTSSTAANASTTAGRAAMPATQAVIFGYWPTTAWPISGPILRSHGKVAISAI